MATQTSTPMYILFSRVFWMMLGPVLMVVALMNIVIGGNGWFTLADITFLLLGGGVVFARWLEFQGGNPQTATGEPATPAQLHRFMLIVTIVGLSAWIVANFVVNHLLVD
jgi:hypothetical protein